jgi:hypothetical protein
MENGLYLVDPDEGGGETCPFEAFCRFDPNTADSWLLIVNAPDSNYTEIPVVERLSSDKRGRLGDKQIKALMTALAGAPTSSNNLRVFVHGSALYPNMNVSMQYNGSRADIGTYYGIDENCINEESTPARVATFQSREYWEFGSGVGTDVRVGFSDTSRTELSGYSGFMCQACVASGPAPSCQLNPGGCCSGRMPGQVWVRW